MGMPSSLGTILCAILIGCQATSGVGSSVPKDVADYDVVDILHLSGRRTGDSDDPRQTFRFSAFGKTHVVNLRRDEDIVSHLGEQGLPVITVNENNIHKHHFKFKQNGIKFYQLEGGFGSFSVERLAPGDRGFAVEGVINNVTHDVVIRPLLRHFRRTTNTIRHSVYIRKRDNNENTQDSLKRRDPHMGFFTNVFDPNSLDGQSLHVQGNTHEQIHAFETSKNRPSLHDQYAGYHDDVKTLANQYLPYEDSAVQVTNTTSVVQATVGVMVWTDLSFFLSFRHLVGNTNAESAILRYIAILVHAGNLRYKYGIRDSSLFISLRLQGVVVCQTVDCSIFTESTKTNGRVDNYKALDAFALQLRRTAHITRYSFNHDYAVAFTRLDLVDVYGNPVGVSFTDKICSTRDGKSSSIVEDQGAFSSIGTFVHELGHTLGSDHDGYFRSTQCSGADGFIMSALSPLTRNGFYFSQCSINSIKTNLMTPNASCVYRHTTDTPGASVSSSTPGVAGSWTYLMPGQMYNRTEQCRQIYGTSFCLSVGTMLEDICYKMFCWDPILSSVCSTKSPAALGTSCGAHKWCIRGQCVHDDKAP